ncbi:hypothetical protein NL108_003013 [Boleophthalmus pectinirostris]|nr:hypothetical protein NL108_003013 [Boleophthalmus pectinirostris]
MTVPKLLTGGVGQKYIAPKKQKQDQYTDKESISATTATKENTRQVTKSGTFRGSGTSEKASVRTVDIVILRYERAWQCAWAVINNYGMFMWPSVTLENCITNIQDKLSAIAALNK